MILQCATAPGWCSVPVRRAIFPQHLEAGPKAHWISSLMSKSAVPPLDLCERVQVLGSGVGLGVRGALDLLVDEQVRGAAPGLLRVPVASPAAPVPPLLLPAVAPLLLPVVGPRLLLPWARRHLIPQAQVILGCRVPDPLPLPQALTPPQNGMGGLQCP